MIDAKEITAAEALRAPCHFFDWHAADSCCRDERADTGSRVHGGLDAAFIERAKNADVRKALHPAATQHERYAFATTAAGLFHHRTFLGSIDVVGPITADTYTTRKGQRLHHQP